MGLNTSALPFVVLLLILTIIMQAFTHSSYSDNILTDSYERLEYLGDAGHLANLFIIVLYIIVYL